MSEPVLTTRNLSRRFGAVTAADDINVTVSAGEIVGVIGANGAGKTTFINMVTGYLPPSDGEIEFLGEPLGGDGPRKLMRRGLSRSFQVPQLFSELTVLDNVVMTIAAAENRFLNPMRPVYDHRRVERADAMLRQMDVAEYRDELVTAMPQGERKLLDIGMALLANPRMVLLDEPTSGVSIEEKYKVMDTVMNVVREHRLTVLFVEHDMEVIRRYVTRLLAFAAGRVIADGPADDVLADDMVQELITGKARTAPAEEA
ncbi:ABC transporter ATP-binding protein [Aquisalimonas sp. 2447]|uniref:ABC transporter ATP-binding protein n=1 Tax=Aquisalimonas sp. 2447 TaxID=2740807 RepID=UPI001432677A|nr:ABC transporter ATP-binding protein [Aquisalimonas sp. 2447]QIT55075.1 ABC transporter ATP-binding protein [Aquisalimonas sp. 2447]